MSKNNKNSNMNFINSKIIEDATKKLQQIEKGQKQAEKYFKEREINEQKLKTIEINLKRKINVEKKSASGIEEKTFDKIENLLHLLGNLDTNALEKIRQCGNEKTNQFVQTDKEETEALKEKYLNLEKENEKIVAKKNELKKDLAVARTEIESLKVFNDKLNKENKLIQNSLEEMSNSREELDIKFKEICNENKELKENLKKYEQNLKEFEDLKNHMEDQLQFDKEIVEEEEKTRLKVIEHYRGSLEMLGYLKIFDKVTYYLQPKDIHNLRLTNRSINIEIETNPFCLRDYYRKIIFSYQKKIFDLNKYDLKKEYHISDGELERIMSDYIKLKKIPGKELKLSIEKAISFMNKDVKQPLGIKSDNIGTPKGQPAATSNVVSNSAAGILGGFGSMFGGMFTGKTPTGTSEKPKSGIPTGNVVGTPNGKLGERSVGSSQSSSRAMSIYFTDTPSEIEKYDRFLIEENVHTQFDIYNFDYSNPQEIKNILNKFLKSNLPTDKLTAFIKEICSEYSDFFYYSTRALNEMKELEILKDALNERYLRFQKLSNQLQDEIAYLSKSKNAHDDKILNKMKSNVSSDSSSELSKLREKLEIYEKKIDVYKDRELQITSEFDSFKIIFLKEIRNLKFDLDEALKQRSLLRNVLIEFKSFFNAATKSS